MNDRPNHHPSEEFLTEYAVGALTGGRSLIAATHLAYCPACRKIVRDAESVASELFDGQAVGEDAMPVDMPHSLGPVDQPAEQETTLPPANGIQLPQPLRSLVGSSVEALPWTNIWFGVKEHALTSLDSSTRLLWIPSGRRMPTHDHSGDEWTMVLHGSFSDKTGRYARGDVQLGVPGLEHQPKADTAGPCLCLVSADSDLKLTGILGALVAWRRRFS